MPVWISAVEWISRGIFVLLILLSIWSVAMMFRCAKNLRLANGQKNDSDQEVEEASKLIESANSSGLKSWADSSNSLRAGTIRIALATTDLQNIDRAVKSYLTRERTRLEQGLTVLATLGSNAPFIGLFGTVLGIIQAFGALGAHSNHSADIMVGISEALVATAIGLFVAIPAVVAYNTFSRKLRVLLVTSESLKDLYVAHAKRV